MKAKQIKQVKDKQHGNGAKEPNCGKQTYKLKHIVNGLITWLPIYLPVSIHHDKNLVLSNELIKVELPP